jgi:hypothetical protein
MLARLELAPCPAFPVGSGLHHYLLDIPESVWTGRARRPAIARRFRPGMHDLIATLKPTDHEWQLRFVNGAAHPLEGTMTFGMLPLSTGDRVSVHEPEGDNLPYVVAEVSLS